MVRFLVATAVLALMPLQAAAERRQFGNILYELPADWWVGTPEDGVLMIFSDMTGDRCEFCKMLLATGRNGGGQVTTFLQGEIARFVEEEDRGDIEVLSPPEQTAMGGRKAALAGIKVGSDMQFLIAVQLDGRFELMGFEGNAYDEEDFAESMAVFQEVALPMFEGITYLSEGAESLLPAPVPGDLDGLWWGWKTSWVMQLDGMMQMEVDQRRIVFWPDGYFYDGTPPEGLKPLNRDRLAGAGVTEFGVYETVGNEVRLTYADGAVEVIPREGDELVDGERRMFAVETLPDGATIQGTVSSFFYTGFTPGSGVSGGVSAGSDTTFRADGTYTGSSFGGAFGNFESGGDVTGGFATSSGDETGGRYEIRDGLVIQYPSDGGAPSASLVYRTESGISIGDRVLETGDD
jgi:hypothetical protein